jgi:hypothetical protein
LNRARIGRSVARRLDRLARRAHAFHRFAHHPLCGRYAGEVIRLGRRARVCRGCALALAGAMVGAVAGALAGTPLVALAGLALAAWLAGLSLRSRRLPKMITRFFAACGLTFAVFALAHTPSAPSMGIAMASCACAAVLTVVYRRRGPDRSPCASCPEWGAPKTCSGFRPIALREKAFMRKAGALLREGGGRGARA